MTNSSIPIANSKINSEMNDQNQIVFVIPAKFFSNFDFVLFFPNIIELY